MQARVLNDYQKLKKLSVDYYKNKDYENSLKIISLLSNLMYNYNIVFCDDEVEKILCAIANEIIKKKDDMHLEENKIVYYDGFGLSYRGLTLNYIKSLTELKYKILYITYEKNKKNYGMDSNMIKKEIEGRGHSIYYIKNPKSVKQIKELYKIILRFSPAKILNYTAPWDVVGIATLSLFQDKCERFLINLTDHAFWLGKIASDYIIEFRSYGFNISCKYRGIPEENEIILP